MVTFLIWYVFLDNIRDFYSHTGIYIYYIRNIKISKNPIENCLEQKLNF